MSEIVTSGGIIAGERIAVSESPTNFQAIEAETGLPLSGVFAEATPALIDQACRSAREAFAVMRRMPAERLGDLLATIADGMRNERVEIEHRCRAETGFLPQRVAGEFDRAVGQLELFADLARRRVWDDRQIDPADPERPGMPRPELRRRKIPVGPVAVFGACNFPLAISTAGNDTVAAFAVGCPVIVKSHPGHPGTCELIGRVIAEAVSSKNFPPGTFSLLHGRQPQTSCDLVAHPSIAAVGFTGSPAAGRALARVAADRDHPIPCFAELGSTNPVCVTDAAMQSRGDDISSGFVASLRFGNGQMCTKPGLVVMTTASARALGEKAATMLHEMDPLPLLNANVAKGFDRGTSRLEENEGVEILTPKPQPTATSTLGPYHRSARLYLLHANETTSWSELLHQETFGPVSLLVACDDEDAMLNVMSQFTGSLTATLHDQDGVDEAFQDAWLDIAMQFAGRIIHNGWPTGMEIGPATHHGGPFPASLDGRSTSVGYASLDRFVRPICFQNWRGFPHDHPSH